MRYNRPFFFSLLLPSIFIIFLQQPLLSSSLSGDDWFQLLDINKDGLLDRKEYDLGLGKLRGFFKKSTDSSAAEADWTTTTTSSDSSSSSSSWRHLVEWNAVKGFWNAFTSAVAMILATEVGDKTFFIAAVLSMQHDRWAVLLGALAALYIMTILSTFMGLILPNLLPKEYTHIIGGILFFYFGVKLYMESRKLEAGKTSEELEEVEEELMGNKKDDEVDEESQKPGRRGTSSKNYGGGMKQWYQVVAQSFSLTFIAEWGDRSQIATIALGAHKNPIGVTVGGCLGHTVCTGIAVVGGRMLAARISEKTVHQWGGIIFLLFGIHSLFFEE